MTDKEILDLFNVMNKRVQDLSVKIDSIFMNLHESSTTNITENDNAICDIADLSDENSIAIEDMAEQISSLDGRVTALEEKE